VSSVRIESNLYFSCPVDAAATDFFRFETAVFEFCEPIKVTMTRDPFVKIF
jgi:hypothetical protein